MKHTVREIDWDRIKSVLPFVTRPGRYVGNELNLIKKDWDQVDVTFALAFPDIYEIGMSNQGLGILYHILNRQEWIAAERVYLPWIDFEAKLRELQVPLFSLESKNPIRRFDILGITLQSELQYTNVLNLLDLSGIPLRSKDRENRDPFVVAGGPCAFNPEPLAEFFDVVVLGDGEEAVLELSEVIRTSKRDRWDRLETLRKMAQMDGFYVPSFYQVQTDPKGRFQSVAPVDETAPEKIRARILDDLASDNYPTRPLVPLIEVTHDRFSVEIMRGCTRGCRFCNAGMVYRPVRERSVEDILIQSKAVLANTGYDEISLVSLSTSDYSHLIELLVSLQKAFKHRGVGISFPSLRPDTFTPEMADLAQGLRRSGLTLAPEAGSQRLRDIINKNNCEDDLLCAVETAFKRGWNRIKLYFMIGLPTETMDDIQAIADLIYKVVQLGKKYHCKEIRVSISPFSPKPHTPFQWEGQDSTELLNEKIDFLKKKIKWKQVKLNWRDPLLSRLEAVLGRGDRRLSGAIFKAWQNGAKLDTWTDQFRYQIWHEAFDSEGLSMEDYLAGREPEYPLPWEHLEKGVTRSFYIRERELAFQAGTTPDCRQSDCKQCGLMDKSVCRPENRMSGKSVMKTDVHTQGVSYGRKVSKVQSAEVHRKIRIGFRKGEQVRFTSHLDTMRIFLRALRRANVPLAFSKGYHAHAKIASGPPLPLGYLSDSEYMDFEVQSQFPKNLERNIAEQLPDGFEVFGIKVLWGKVPSLNQSISLADYRVCWNGSADMVYLNKQIAEFLKQNTYKIKRISKNNVKEVDIRSFVQDMSCSDHGLEVKLHLTSSGTAKIEEIIQALIPAYESFPKNISIKRTGLYIEKQGVQLNPLNIESEK